MQKPDFTFDQDHDPEAAAMREPKIVGEICARLIQWANIASRSQVARWLDSERRYAATGYTSPPPRGLGSEANTLRLEIVERLGEWRSFEGGEGRLARWLNMLGAIWSTGGGGPAMLWLYIAFQTGDARQIAASFEERGEAKAVPRQAAHQEFTQALDTLRRLNPALARALRELYERHSPEAAAAGGLVATGEHVVRGS